MPGARERAIRRRIRSIQTTRKVTRAMELVAASRIVKAQQAVVAARPYSERITEVVADLAAEGVDHPLLTPRERVSTVGFVVVSSDRGLAGAYNANVIRAAERDLLDRQEQGASYSLIVVGKKAQAYFRYRGYRIDAAHTGIDRPSYEDARQVAREVMRRHEDGSVDEVRLFYTEFISLGRQRVVGTQLVPIEPSTLEPSARDNGGGARSRAAEGPRAGYEFEPSPEAILATLLPRYVESRLFAAMLDAAASEQAARQRAMKSATDNADELTKTLGRMANRARQDSITTEIMEVVGGAEALAMERRAATTAEARVLSLAGSASRAGLGGSAGLDSPAREE
jgi:F-type H+-transporting ATPase subunit gamma